MISEFVTSETSAFSGDFRQLCMRLIESPLEDDWQFNGLEGFGMSEPAA